MKKLFLFILLFSSQKSYCATDSTLFSRTEVYGTINTIYFINNSSFNKNFGELNLRLPFRKNKRLNIVSGLQYSYFNFSSSYLTIDRYTIEKDVKFNINSICIPFFIRYSFLSENSLFTEFGVFKGFGIGNKKGTRYSTNPNGMSFTSSFNEQDLLNIFGAGLSVGYIFNIKTKLLIFKLGVSSTILIDEGFESILPCIQYSIGYKFGT